MRILIAEDDQVLADGLLRTLRSSGAAVDHVPDGSQADAALISALEGRRGEVRVRPPYPTVQGLFGMPTVVNNVETLANVPWIVRHGPAAYRELGTQASSGTKAICLNAGFARPGIVEIASTR